MQTAIKNPKIAIIGAGASGLMCACMQYNAQNCTVFDKNPIVGKKLLLTGNGRCNLTNLVAPQEFLNSVPKNAEFLAGSINNFTPQNAVDFFNSIGVKTQVEDNNRVLVAEGRATTVCASLKDFALTKGVNFKLETQVKEIKKEVSGFNLELECCKTNATTQEHFDIVVIATGGKSYPQTGSSGDGFSFLITLGHTVNPLRPALSGLQFIVPTGFFGTGIYCGAEILDSNLKQVTTKETGDLMFTRLGVSGPVIHKISSLFMSDTIKKHYLQIDFVPNLDSDNLKNKIANLIKTNSKKTPFYIFREFVPIKIADWLVGFSGLSKTKPCSALKKDEVNKIFFALKTSKMAIKDFEPLEQAVVTRGGAKVSEIDNNTMQSKLVDNLYIIGETLDIDGLSGGFNLQIAFCTAAKAAASIHNA